MEDALIRVQFWPDGQPRLDRTWLVAGPDGDVPREGRLVLRKERALPPPFSPAAADDAPAEAAPAAAEGDAA